jgi:hypothetical protein
LCSLPRLAESWFVCFRFQFQTARLRALLLKRRSAMPPDVTSLAAVVAHSHIRLLASSDRVVVRSAAKASGASALALAACWAAVVASASAPELASVESPASCCSSVLAKLLILRRLLSCWRCGRGLRRGLRILRCELWCRLLDLLSCLASLLSRPSVLIPLSLVVRLDEISLLALLSLRCCELSAICALVTEVRTVRAADVF